MPAQVSSDVVERLLAEAHSAHPQECCGILLGGGDAITAIRPARNVHPEPARRFEIDPQALVDAYREARGHRSLARGGRRGDLGDNRGRANHLVAFGGCRVREASL